MTAPPPAPQPDIPSFTPVPGARAKWTPKTQIAFIHALARCGIVREAARAVGCTAQSANRLRRQPGADSFAQAWDWAIEMGLDAQRALAFARMDGVIERPLVRRGKVVGTVSQPDVRLAFAALRALSAEVSGKRARLPHRRRIRARARKRVRSALWPRLRRGAWLAAAVVETGALLLVHAALRRPFLPPPALAVPPE